MFSSKAQPVIDPESNNLMLHSWHLKQATEYQCRNKREASLTANRPIETGRHIDFEYLDSRYCRSTEMKNL